MNFTRLSSSTNPGSSMPTTKISTIEFIAVCCLREVSISGIRSELDGSNNAMGKKVRNAIMDKVFYLATVGEKEKSENKVAIRARDSREIITMDLDEFITKLKQEISSKTL